MLYKSLLPITEKGQELFFTEALLDEIESRPEPTMMRLHVTPTPNGPNDVRVTLHDLPNDIQRN